MGERSLSGSSQEGGLTVHKMTGFQRVVVGLAALAVAIRAFLPVTARSQVLLAPTLLHIVGIVVLAVAVFILFPSPRWRSFLLWAAAVALFAGWLLFIVLAIALLREGGIATSWDQINWRASVFGVGSLLILAALTWLWTIARRQRAFTPLMKTLAGVILLVGLSFVTLAGVLPLVRDPYANIFEKPTSPPPAPIAQTSPTFTFEPVPAVLTVKELTESILVGQASTVLDIYVDIGHLTFQQLHASDKDTLCAAGKAIRDSMRTHHNTLADLNHTERAIYDITAPAGRCH